MNRSVAKQQVLQMVNKNLKNEEQKKLQKENQKQTAQHATASPKGAEHKKNKDAKAAKENSKNEQLRELHASSDEISAQKEKETDQKKDLTENAKHHESSPNAVQHNQDEDTAFDNQLSENENEQVDAIQEDALLTRLQEEQLQNDQEIEASLVSDHDILQSTNSSDTVLSNDTTENHRLSEDQTSTVDLEIRKQTMIDIDASNALDNLHTVNQQLEERMDMWDERCVKDETSLSKPWNELNAEDEDALKSRFLSLQETAQEIKDHILIKQQELSDTIASIEHAMEADQLVPHEDLSPLLESAQHIEQSMDKLEELMKDIRRETYLERTHGTDESQDSQQDQMTWWDLTKNDLEKLYQEAQIETRERVDQSKEHSIEEHGNVATNEESKSSQNDAILDFENSIEEIIDEGIERIDGEQFEADALLRFTPHGKATHNRKELEVSGRDVESAHVAAQSAMKGVKDYNPRHALTLLLPKEVHKELDSHWKQVFKEEAKKRQDDSITAQRLFDVIRESIELTSSIGELEKRSMIARLADEIFKEYNLRPDDLVRLPYSK